MLVHVCDANIIIDQEETLKAGKLIMQVKTYMYSEYIEMYRDVYVYIEREGEIERE